MKNVFTLLTILTACLFSSNIQAESNVTIQKEFKCWSEATQKDTTLYLYVNYGMRGPEESKYSLEHRKPSSSVQKHLGINYFIIGCSGYSENMVWTNFICVNRVNIFPSKSDPSKILRWSDLHRQMDCIRSSFKKAKEIYIRWSETAKREKVSSFRKVMTDDEIFFVPGTYRCGDKANKMYYYTGVTDLDTLKLVFDVDGGGKCKILWCGYANTNNSEVSFVRDETLAHSNDLTSDITKRVRIYVKDAGLWFRTPEQLQSFIDLLDYDKLEAECKEKYSTGDERDALFK